MEHKATLTRKANESEVTERKDASNKVNPIYSQQPKRQDTISKDNASSVLLDVPDY